MTFLPEFSTGGGGGGSVALTTEVLQDPGPPALVVNTLYLNVGDGPYAMPPSTPDDGGVIRLGNFGGGTIVLNADGTDLFLEGSSATPSITVAPGEDVTLIAFQDSYIPFAIWRVIREVQPVRFEQDVDFAYPEPLPAFTITDAGQSTQKLTANAPGAFPLVAGLYTVEEDDTVLIVFEDAGSNANAAYRLTVPGDGSTPWELSIIRAEPSISTISLSQYYVREEQGGDAPFAGATFRATDSAQSDAGSTMTLVRERLKTPASQPDLTNASFTIYPDRIYPVDLFGGATTLTLPDIPTNGARRSLHGMSFGVRVTIEGGNLLTVSTPYGTIESPDGTFASSFTMVGQPVGALYVWMYQWDGGVTGGKWRLVEQRHEGNLPILQASVAPLIPNIFHRITTDDNYTFPANPRTNMRIQVVKDYTGAGPSFVPNGHNVVDPNTEAETGGSFSATSWNRYSTVEWQYDGTKWIVKSSWILVTP